VKPGPYYVVETSGIKINVHAKESGSQARLEHELLVAGPNGHHAWRRTVPRDRGYKVTYDERLAAARAAAASVCALLNEETTA
jgi:hypothetical protein